MLALDVETTGLDWSSPDFRVFLAQWTDGAGDRGYCDEDTGWQPLLDVLARHRNLVGANFAFDEHALRAAGIIDLSERHHRHDVLTLARITLPGRFQYGLKPLAVDLLSADAADEQTALKAAAGEHSIRWTKEDKDFHGLWRASPELMVKYGMADVDLTLQLWNLLYGRASAKDLAVYELEISKVSPILRESERRGILVDKTRLVALERELERERDELQATLIAGGITPRALGIDRATAKEVKAGSGSAASLLADLQSAGVPLYRKTPKGNKLSVDADSLNEFKGSHPIVGDLLEWRRRNKTLSTYVAALHRAAPNIHPTVRQAEARTSRMSYANPNLQNLPTTKGIRDVLVPAPGNAFIVADFDSIEIYVLAYYLNDAGLIEKLQAGMDFHSLTAAAVFGGKYEDYLKGGPNDKLRSKAKTTAFSLIYGAGARLISIRLGISIEEASALKAKVIAAIPGYARFDAKIKADMRRRYPPYVTTILGRRLAVPKDKEYVATNSLVQGSAAEIMKLGMVAAAEAVKPFGAHVAFVVHDEVIVEGPERYADEIMAATIDAMQTCYPLRPSLKATAHWSAVSYGAAKG